MERDNIQFLQQFFGKEKMNERMKIRKEIDIHSECVMKIDKINDNLLKEQKKYKSLYNINTGLINKIKDLQSHVDELLEWKNNHNCNDNINI